MKQAQKFILWGTGIFLMINLVAIGLSWGYFGYLDVEILWEMGLISLPPVIVALGSYLLLGVQPDAREVSVEQKNERITVR
ncbi:MAG: hypothetical protein HY645_05185 [Acidobacteria bacterium]|nr:hypothetical protein [Acidobacteriota bacterium]